MADETKKDDSQTGESKTEKLLRQIREDFHYVKAYWKENYDEAAKDMDVIAAKPPKEFQDDRANRPCIWPDETSQYVNQANNNLRESPRGVTLSPKEGGTDQDVEHRENYIRGIEDASHGLAVRETAFESAVQCGFGHWKLTIVKAGKDQWEPRLRRIPNWATVFRDPDCKEADFSDANVDFVIDSLRESAFERKYPNATKRSFTDDDRQIAPDWFSGGYITVAEYWTREEITAADGEKTHQVTQHITNGIEILDTTDWIGSYIPIISVLGKEIYIKQGGQSKRMILSMIRNGRPAQQMMAYIASQEAEEIGQAPRAAVIGMEGTFAHADQTWKIAHKQPFAYLEVKVPDNWPKEWGPPPIPQRSPFTPNIQAYEIAYERWRRSHQASVAGTPLPTDAQKVNDKSGIALEKIQDAGMLGNFHFTSNYTRALHNEGMQLNELITILAKRKSLPSPLLGRDKEGKAVKMHLAQHLIGDGATGQSEVPPEQSEALPEAQFFFADRGKFTVTVSDGPNKASEREAAAEFADTLLETIPQLGLPPMLTQKVLSIAVQLKNIGALGDQLAKLLDPQDQTMQQLQAAQMQIAEFQKQAAELSQEVQQLKLEKAGKVIDNEYRLQVTQLQNDIKVLIAEISAKAQSQSERIEMFMKFWQENHGAAHDLAMQKDQQAHDAQQAQLAQQAAAQQAAAQPQPAQGQPNQP